MLLERLFRFIRSRDTPLNPVLAGYFAKLMTILINRRQKVLIPYIFGEESDVLDNLLYHVYQKSISEVLNKLLNIQHHDFETAVANNIKAKQNQVLIGLLDKLSSEHSEEHNLNAAVILVDLIDNKEDFNLICQRHHINRLIQMAFSQEETTTQGSQKATLSFLIYLIQTYQEKRKDERNSNNANDNDDEDSTIQEQDEANESPLLEVLTQSVPLISHYLTLPQSASRIELDTSYDVRMTPPLGLVRLKIIDLVLHLLKLNKKAILEPLSNTDILAQINRFVEAFPWNNFLQLKVQSIYEELIENVQDYKGALLATSEIGPTIIRLANNTIYEHSSKRPIRQGYMALVVKIANLLQKHRATNSDVGDYLEKNQWAEEWQQFVDGELKRSNDTNNKNLGGQQPRNLTDDEDNEKDYDMNMDKIMAKFSNFNSQMSAGKNSSLSSNDNDDDDEEDVEIDRQDDHDNDAEENKGGDDEPRHESPTKQVNPQRLDDDEEEASIALKPIESEFKEPEPLIKEFASNEYWAPLNPLSASIDDLLNDYE